MSEHIVVPHTSLSPVALRRLIEELVTRDGTDYGARERSLDEKVEDVRRQLQRGEISIVFEPQTNAANLLPTNELRSRSSD